MRLKYYTLYFQITGVATVGATRGGRDAERSAAPPPVLINTHYNVQNVHVCVVCFFLIISCSDSGALLLCAIKAVIYNYTYSDIHSEYKSAEQVA